MEWFICVDETGCIILPEETKYLFGISRMLSIKQKIISMLPTSTKLRLTLALIHDPQFFFLTVISKSLNCNWSSTGSFAKISALIHVCSLWNLCGVESALCKSKFCCLRWKNRHFINNQVFTCIDCMRRLISFVNLPAVFRVSTWLPGSSG